MLAARIIVMPLIKVMMITLVIRNGAALSVYLSLIFFFKGGVYFYTFFANIALLCYSIFLTK